MANYPAPNYGAYDQPSAPYAYPSNTQPGFVPPPYSAQQGYPPQQGYPQQGYPQPGYPPQQGYPAQQGYPTQQGYVGGLPVVTQPGPGYYPAGQPPTQTVVHQKEPSSGSGDCMRNCCLCALCMTLCCWCCSD